MKKKSHKGKKMVYYAGTSSKESGFCKIILDLIIARIIQHEDGKSSIVFNWNFKSSGYMKIEDYIEKYKAVINPDLVSMNGETI